MSKYSVTFYSMEALLQANGIRETEPFSTELNFPDHTAFCEDLADIEEQLAKHALSVVTKYKERYKDKKPTWSNGIYCYAQLKRGQRKPNGWNKSRRLNVEIKIIQDQN